MTNEINPYFKLYDLIDNDFKKDKELIEQFIDKSIEHLVKEGISPDDASYKIKMTIKRLEEIVTDRCINYKEFLTTQGQNETLLKINEAAERLNLSRQQVYNLINDGVLEEVRVGNSKRVKSSEVDRYMSGN